MARWLPPPVAVQPTTPTPRLRVRRRRTHRRKANRQRILAYTAMLLLGVGFGSALGFVAWNRTDTHARNEPLAITGDAGSASQTTTDPDPTSAGRPIYRHSIVPGGVYSVAEVIDAVKRDPVVAVHYQSVNLKALQVERLAAPRSMFVSYRVGDQIYWTKHRVQLKAGETVLTDGHTIIRGRCGNCVSPDSQDAVEGNDAAANELDQVDTRPQAVAAPPFRTAMDDALVGPRGLLPSRFGPGLAASAFAPASSSGPEGFPLGLLGAPFLGVLPGGSGVGPNGPALSPAGTPIAGGPTTPGSTDIPDVPTTPGSPTPPGLPTTPEAPTAPGSPNGPESPTPGPGDSPIPLVPPGEGGPYIPPVGGAPLTPVPEPGTIMLIGSGLAGVVGRGVWRRKKQQ